MLNVHAAIADSSQSTDDISVKVVGPESATIMPKDTMGEKENEVSGQSNTITAVNCSAAEDVEKDDVAFQELHPEPSSDSTETVLEESAASLNAENVASSLCSTMTELNNSEAEDVDKETTSVEKSSSGLHLTSDLSASLDLTKCEVNATSTNAENKDLNRAVTVMDSPAVEDVEKDRPNKEPHAEPPSNITDVATPLDLVKCKETAPSSNIDKDSLRSTSTAAEMSSDAEGVAQDETTNPEPHSETLDDVTEISKSSCVTISEDTQQLSSSKTESAKSPDSPAIEDVASENRMDQELPSEPLNNKADISTSMNLTKCKDTASPSTAENNASLMSRSVTAENHSAAELVALELNPELSKTPKDNTDLPTSLDQNEVIETMASSNDPNNNPFQSKNSLLPDVTVCELRVPESHVMSSSCNKDTSDVGALDSSGISPADANVDLNGTFQEAASKNNATSVSSVASTSENITAPTDDTVQKHMKIKQEFEESTEISKIWQSHLTALDGESSVPCIYTLINYLLVITFNKRDQVTMQHLLWQYYLDDKEVRVIMGFWFRLK